ncbi:Psilocybin cluster transcription regulator [Psilocybe cubensis]|uniref:Psilocybin cluster transcription regulator n=2 Tax=Psilocybe cubensis TaxID=181762 RepID=PSIR_PSICU|nr:Psilocybin cluster transcription regulator [Psilocybe cubensis]P0DPB0.1 RecName: Full=Psilocybin cluster transcription regulator [Psilocybe cubensis]ASU62243.1 putative transcriptional regulator [Psilocybe cubensis]KAH9476866.1 Psilocybin cluster transcription regulator [Psilocybe cubensis]
MAPATPATHDPALSHGAPPAPGAPAPANAPPNASGDIAGMQLSGLDQSQIMNLLRSLPGMFSGGKIPDQGQGNKEDAAQTLSNLAQAQPYGQQLPLHYQAGGPGGLPGINDPGPSTHPRGPPNLGQLSAVAMQAAPAPIQHPDQQTNRNDGEQAGNASASTSGKDGDNAEFVPPPAPAPTTGRRGGRSATMGSDEWSRQRKDNHKEVERRRRGNINEGINELGRIVPSGSGEKAKGAILSRAVQYIHHLKENEARNIEKWTLEKLLMDQAMGDLQAQLEEVKRLWEEERMARTRLEAELEVLRNMNGVNAGSAPASKDESAAGTKRRSTDGAEAATAATESSTANAEGERDGKRQRTE